MVRGGLSGGKTKIGFAKASHKVAKHSAKLDAKALIDKDVAQGARAWSAIASTVTAGKKQDQQSAAQKIRDLFFPRPGGGGPGGGPPFLCALRARRASICRLSLRKRSSWRLPSLVYRRCRSIARLTRKRQARGWDSGNVDRDHLHEGPWLH